MGSGSSSRNRPPIDRNLDDLEPGFSHEGAVNSKRSATFLVRAVMLLAPIPGCVVVPGVECRDRLPVRRLIVGQEPLEPGLRGSIAITSRQQLSSEPSSALAFQRIDLEQGEHRMSSNLRVTHVAKAPPREASAAAVFTLHRQKPLPLQQLHNVPYVLYRFYVSHLS